MAQNALIIEDNEEWQNVVREPLESLGLIVAVTDSRTKARQLLDGEHYDIVIIDIMMDEEDLEIAKPKTAVLITYIRQHYPNTKCAILTGHGTLDFAIGAFRQLGIVDFYEKGTFNVVEFMKSIKELLALTTSGETISSTKNLPSNTNTIFHIELERRKSELIIQINNRRKESEEVLLTIRNKRILAKGNKVDLDDDEWITKRRKTLDERYRSALAKIDGINSLDETGSVQLWLEKEYHIWLGLSAE